MPRKGKNQQQILQQGQVFEVFGSPCPPTDEIPEDANTYLRQSIWVEQHADKTACAEKLPDFHQSTAKSIFPSEPQQHITVTPEILPESSWANSLIIKFLHLRQVLSCMKKYREEHSTYDSVVYPFPSVSSKKKWINIWSSTTFTSESLISAIFPTISKETLASAAVFPLCNKCDQSNNLPDCNFTGPIQRKMSQNLETVEGKFDSSVQMREITFLDKDDDGEEEEEKEESDEMEEDCDEDECEEELPTLSFLSSNQLHPFEEEPINPKSQSPAPSSQLPIPPSSTSNLHESTEDQTKTEATSLLSSPPLSHSVLPTYLPPTSYLLSLKQASIVTLLTNLCEFISNTVNLLSATIEKSKEVLADKQHDEILKSSLTADSIKIKSQSETIPAAKANSCASSNDDTDQNSTISDSPIKVMSDMSSESSSVGDLVEVMQFKIEKNEALSVQQNGCTKVSDRPSFTSPLTNAPSKSMESETSSPFSTSSLLSSLPSCSIAPLTFSTFAWIFSLLSVLEKPISATVSSHLFALTRSVLSLLSLCDTNDTLFTAAINLTINHSSLSAILDVHSEESESLKHCSSKTGCGRMWIQEELPETEKIENKNECFISQEDNSNGDILNGAKNEIIDEIKKIWKSILQLILILSGVFFTSSLLALTSLEIPTFSSSSGVALKEKNAVDLSNQLCLIKDNLCVEDSESEDEEMEENVSAGYLSPQYNDIPLKQLNQNICSTQQDPFNNLCINEKEEGELSEEDTLGDQTEA
ncbi:uncharacterized protein MONOS_11329 [Monocercomonoides exilis]|uniref:uncharacterized protein n=1 Tax=Monocercomonoides exilis TaxID=2049356 RepID=UPI00355A26A2|nr:hypothetical protein MONOS_11329 [Monocercomonoides exilis]|eukprot:MONOS_11329.1-p1 / transcript=MONOS_11329.1 / gene=MONOS_11329 / organism=Monocercomonoides_exilis_PA203 / gene_product=unspecified product / transcript_product=unspecified product / location=Mono_scaffold00563:16963-19453(+) / protein_length=758 / sequence_SO=supercontig / SO=protein_coding / is_pseudo=false